METISITRHGSGAAGEYRAAVVGFAAIGRLTWVRRGGVVIAEHTRVPPEIGGRGVAARLVEALIEDARGHGDTIDPQCSYVAAAFARHAEWADLRA